VLEVGHEIPSGHGRVAGHFSLPPGTNF
jgi:hypothetical protein